MHTTHLLTVSPSMHCVGGWGCLLWGVPALGGGACSGGCLLWGCLLWGRCLLLGGGCHALGGSAQGRCLVCSGVHWSGGVSAPGWGRWLLRGVPGPGGVCSGGCLVLLPGLGGDGIPVCTEADPTLCTEFLTHATENITLPQTSFAGSKNLLSQTKRVYFK